MVTFRKTGRISHLTALFPGETCSMRLHQIAHVHFVPDYFLNNGMIRIVGHDGDRIVLIYKRRNEAGATRWPKILKAAPAGRTSPRRCCTAPVETRPAVSRSR